MSFPYEIKDLDPETSREMSTHFSGGREGYVQVGPEKYLIGSIYRNQAAGYYNMELRDDDLWVVTFPRSGTTWMQELAWLIKNDLDYDTASKKMLIERYAFLEVSMLLTKVLMKELIEESHHDPKCINALKMMSEPGYDAAAKMTSPRHFKTHLPLSLLPPKLLDTCKVIYVARNPKDVVLSYYYHNRKYKSIGFESDMKTYWDFFKRGLTFWSPFWSHVNEAWERRNHPNLLFIFYEDMKKDLPGSIRKVSQFLNKKMNDDQVAQLASHLDIKNFKSNPMIDTLPEELKGIEKEGEESFIRQGRSGQWEESFTPDMKKEADEWIKKHENKTDLRFRV
ncbi:sulfotransferase 1C4-like isoform X1 [Ischnura elegans]|uniref:sulfotransferase 1C4-like isoform X1 n=1 Tax=Ischnura elegans TaxID=197161 RepID=UPI001ED88012|nr:sulfotransferase 1C4-like isoform X1 [Ischnura elegans]